MKTIAIEEHFLPAEVRQAWNLLPANLQDPSLKLFSDDETTRRLEEFGERRLADMDAMGVDIQVISLTTPATQNLKAEEAVRFARVSNDLAAEAVMRHPSRLQAFATVPTPNPTIAVSEFERCIGDLGMKGAMLTGRTRTLSMDALEFRPLFAAAARLRVPVYLHPQIPQQAIRSIYYDGFEEVINTVFATGGWGWHAEAGIQAMRLVLAGTFDRHPELQVILGHWGEIIFSFMERIAPAMDRFIKNKLGRTMEDYLKQNFYVTPSGILSQRYLRNALETIGVDRIMFSMDYPFQFAEGAASFLDESALATEEKMMIAHQNWERLVTL